MGDDEGRDRRDTAPRAGAAPARPVNANDVARLAGVSRSAVSRTFTPGASVAPATRERVLKAAQALNYRVNMLARGLINQRSDLVGVVVAGADNPFRAAQITALMRTIQEANLRPMMVQADPGSDMTVIVGHLLHYLVAGIVITSDTPPWEIVAECSKTAVPLVVVNRDVKGLSVDGLVGFARRRVRVAHRHSPAVTDILPRQPSGGIQGPRPQRHHALRDRGERRQHL